MEEYETKAILCPQCGRKVGTYDGRSKMDYITRCKKCKKRVVYHVATGETKLSDIPKRTTSSGMIFV